MALTTEQITELATEFNCSEDLVKEAGSMGYDPNRYDRNDPNFRTPEQFLSFGRQLNPILRENNKRLIQKNEELTKEVLQIKEAVAKFAKLHEQTEEEAYKRALEDLKQEKIVAIQNQDAAAQVEADEKIATLKAARTASETTVPAGEPAPKVSAEVIETYSTFLVDHPWADPDSPEYNEDMTAFAVAVGEQRIKKGLPHTGTAFKTHLDAVAEKVEARFSDHTSDDVEGRPAPAVESGFTGAPSKGSKHTYAQLPKVYKDACDFLVSTGTMTVEKYLSTVDWSKINK